MDKTLTYRTLNGTYQITFRNWNQLIEDIETETGIYGPDQTLYQNGNPTDPEYIRMNLEKNIRHFQVGSLNQSTLRFFINTPQGKIRTHVISAFRKTVRDLICSFLTSAKNKSLEFSMKDFALVYNSSILPLEQTLENFPTDSEIDLVQESVYDISPIFVTVWNVMEDAIYCHFEPSDTIIKVKQHISEIERKPVDVLMLVRARNDGKLEDDKDLQYYGVKNNSHLNCYIIVKVPKELKSSNPIDIFKVIAKPQPTFEFRLDNEGRPSFLEADSDLPKWKVLYKGISVIGTCFNSECETFQQPVARRLGFGIFHMIEEKDNVECLSCREKLRNVHQFIFFDCLFKVLTRDINGNEIETLGEAGRDSVGKFFTEDLSWRGIRIQVDISNKNNS